MIYLFSTIYDHMHINMFYSVVLEKLIFCKTSTSMMIDGDYTYFTYMSNNYTEKHRDYLHFKVDAENYKYITYDELEPNIRIFAEIIY